MVYDFLLNMWIMRRIDDVYLEGQVKRGHISRKEKDMILATPQVAK